MFPRGLIGAAAGAVARSSEPDRGMGSCDPLFLRCLHRQLAGNPPIRRDHASVLK